MHGSDPVSWREGLTMEASDRNGTSLSRGKLRAPPSVRTRALEWYFARTSAPLFHFRLPFFAPTQCLTKTKRQMVGIEGECHFSPPPLTKRPKAIASTRR